MIDGKSWRRIRIYTIGHSTRTLDEFLELLRSFDVSVVVDIRTIPRSRHNPQFNTDALRSSLRRGRFEYVHLPRLGGLRRARKDSSNTAWRNASFRGFADYMSTEDFEAGLAELRSLIPNGRLVLMCAEAVPWRCHRSLVADALTARGALVEHITGASRSRLHEMTDFAQVTGERVTYPGANIERKPRRRDRRPLERTDGPGAALGEGGLSDRGTDLAARSHDASTGARGSSERLGRKPRRTRTPRAVVRRRGVSMDAHANRRAR